MAAGAAWVCFCNVSESMHACWAVLIWVSILLLGIAGYFQHTAVSEGQGVSNSCLQTLLVV
jgi:hypothetical protein